MSHPSYKACTETDGGRDTDRGIDGIYIQNPQITSDRKSRDFEEGFCLDSSLVAA